VSNILAALPKIKATLPSALNIRPLFDQSLFVRASLQGVLREGAIAAALVADDSRLPRQLAEHAHHRDFDPAVDHHVALRTSSPRSEFFRAKRNRKPTRLQAPRARWRLRRTGTRPALSDTSTCWLRKRRFWPTNASPRKSAGSGWSAPSSSSERWAAVGSESRAAERRRHDIHPKEQARTHQCGRFVNDDVALCCIQRGRQIAVGQSVEDVSDERDGFDDSWKLGA